MTETSIWAIFGLVVIGLGSLWIMSPAGFFGDGLIRQWFRRGSSKRFSDALGLMWDTTGRMNG